MAWNSYIDTTISYSPECIDKVCIIGLADASHWTSADHPYNFTIEQSEAKAISDAMKTDPMNVANMQANGIYLQGQKYRFLRVDPEEGIIIGKLKDHGGITIQKSVRAIVLVHTKEGAAQGNANNGLKTIIDYLKSTNN